MRLIVDVPLEAFLSGGVDSSVIVSLMALTSADPVNTYAIGFDRAEFNETHYARQVAERYRTRHREHRVDPDDFDLLGTLASAYDEPFADSSALPTYRVCETVRQQVAFCCSACRDWGQQRCSAGRIEGMHE